MAATTFRLRGTRIHLDFHYGQSQRFRYATGLKVEKAKNWDAVKMRVRNVAEEKFKTQVNNQLNKLAAKLEEEYARMTDLDEVEVDHTQLKEFCDIFFKKKTESQSKKKKVEFLEYYDWYIDNYETRPLPSTGKPLGHGTVRTYRNSYNIIKRFNDEVYPLYFRTITLSFYDDFVGWLYDQNYSANYVGTHIKNLKTIMQSAFDRELHKNFDYKKKGFRKPVENVDNIFLSEDEILNIKKLDFSGFKTRKKNTVTINSAMLEKARDLFLFGCYTGLRVSDYTRLKKGQIFTPDDQRYFLKMVAKKGEKPVVIPLNSTVREILAKNKGNPPEELHDQHINYCLKIIGELAEINNHIEIHITKGGKPTVVSGPKYEFMVNHTARRSFCTNAYLSGMPTADIMAISGHATEKVFYNYIKVNSLEKAMKIGKHKFFQ